MMSEYGAQSARENLLSAFDYLLYLNRLRTKPIFRLADHQLPFYHEHQFEGLPGIETDLVEGDQEIWLRIRRLRAHQPPEPPESLLPWINLPSDLGQQPTLAESIDVSALEGTENGGRAPAQVQLRLEDQPEIQAAFETYLENQWRRWSTEEQPRRQTIRLYDRFFSLHQEAGGESAEDAIEIGWGVGMVLWNCADKSENIAYPLISKTVEIQMDDNTLSLNITPTEREQTVNVDAFIALDLPGEDVEARAKYDFEAAETTFSPFDSDCYDGILRFAAGHLDSHGAYWPDENTDRQDRTLPAATDHLIVTDSWTIFARHRGTNFIAADIQRLRAAVLAGIPVEGAPALVVTEPPDTSAYREKRHYRGISNPRSGGQGETGVDKELEDLYFPKPFNEEQVRIVERTEQADGVVVQGPPGTGKTHTIANIICHYLALGRRILVTSQHEAPLAALRDQIPEPLRPLTISLLTSEREGLKQLEQSVRKIAGDIAQLNPHELDQHIQAETKTSDRLHQHLAALDRDLRRWGDKQTSEVPFLGDGTRPAKLAQQVVERAAEYAWFPDRLKGEQPPIAQFSNEDIVELREARERLGPDLIYLFQNLPATDQLPLPEDMVRLHEDLCHYDALGQAVTEGNQVPPLRKYSAETIRQAESLREQADTIHALLRAADSVWHRSARKLLGRTESEAIAPLAEHLRNWIDSALEADKQRQAFLGDAIEMPAEAEVDESLHTAVVRAAKGKRPFGLFRIFRGNKETKTLFRKIRIQSARPTTVEQWRRIRDFLDFSRTISSLVTQWGQLRNEFGGPDLEKAYSIVAAKRISSIAGPLAGLWMLEDKLARPFIDAAKAIFPSGFDFERLTQDINELERLIEALATHLEYSGLKAASNDRQAIREAIAECRGPLIDRITQVLDQNLGRDHCNAERIMDEWQSVLTERRRLERLHGDLNTVTDITRTIASSGAPHWAKALQQQPVEHDNDPWTPVEWRGAWEWARAKGYLEAIDGHKALQKLAHDRRQAEDHLNRANLEVVKLRTWRKLKENMTGRISAALQSYLTAITRIGRGTGVRAKRYRRDAQQAMNIAYGAVPCWIMPHWRVSEALPPQFGLFDLVIIDEASQSDAWALPAIARAKKLLVVGDDKQVSPSDVGVAEADIRSLQASFLSTLTYGQHLLPGSSIYDLASTMFATDIIRLREHFRCVEPIIRFSNHTFYNDEIRPLRVPKPSERLDPPLIDVFVKGGYRQDRKKINEPEARFIVEEIRQISQDPQMANRTIGVVSLLGSDQAKHIQEQLLTQLGEEIILRHSIRCGDAMHFQGKEADIVFISMVAAGRIRADSGRTFEQRYNVACSRPRDRLYVVHSFSRNEVQEGDLRAKLLDHLANPLGINDREVNDLRELCQSEFEREVFDALTSRGYRVTPQVRVGNDRIDLVVEGEDDRRLAIECDGDQYHDVDRWMYDIGRQRVLERMGWQFWRCWASSWTSERQACIEDLLATLNDKGIDPLGTEGAGKTLLVGLRVVEPEGTATNS